MYILDGVDRAKRGEGGGKKKGEADDCLPTSTSPERKIEGEKNQVSKAR